MQQSQQFATEYACFWKVKCKTLRLQPEGTAKLVTSALATCNCDIK
jgi:hypothetical protein